MDFDWDKIVRAFGYLVPVIILIIINVLSRKQKKQKKQVTAVKSLLSEIEYNQKLTEAFSGRPQAKKFRTFNWERNRDTMNSLENAGLYSTMLGAYEIIKEFNREIDMSKKFKSTSYLIGIKVERLKEPLAKSKQGLQEWLELNKSREKMPAGT